jgi:hypothetical protein
MKDFARINIIFSKFGFWASRCKKLRQRLNSGIVKTVLAINIAKSIRNNKKYY